MASNYRWYSVGQRREPDAAGAYPPAGSQKIEILGWSRSQVAALGRPGTVAAYYASSRRMAARMAREDRGFEIDWRKF